MPRHRAGRRERPGGSLHVGGRRAPLQSRSHPQRGIPVFLRQRLRSAYPEPGRRTLVLLVCRIARFHMTIDTLVGLPHLGEWLIHNRAVDVRVPGLLSANAMSRGSRRKGGPEWQGWNLGQLANARRLASLSPDSAGYVAMARYGGFPWSTTDYLTLAASYPFRWFASMDYCVEPEIARDREEVLDRISRTIRAHFDCSSGARALCIQHLLKPVIEWKRHVEGKVLAASVNPTGND